MLTDLYESVVAVEGDPLDSMTAVVGRIDDECLLYESDGVYSLGIGAAARFTVGPRTVRVRSDGVDESRLWTSHPTTVVADLLADLQVPDWRVYGTMSFEMAHAGTARGAELDEDVTLMELVLPTAEIRLDGGVARIRAQDADRVAELAEALSRPAEPGTPAQPVAVPLVADEAAARDYRARVADAVDHIRAGRLQKVIVSRSVALSEHVDVDLVETFRRGRRRNSPARSFLLRRRDEAAVGFCPEVVLVAEPSGEVRTQPLAGTRARGEGTEVDAARRADLTSDPKEIYEHAVSVRTSVEELGEVCEPDSVSVRDFMSVSDRGTVQHLGSSVVGRLTTGHGPWDALRVLFPAVTASGIPKADACAQLHRFEPEPRGLYSGAVLVADADGRLEAALILRTLFQRAGRTWLRAGAGVVAASTPDREFTETCEKLRSVALHVVATRSGPPPVGVAGDAYGVVRTDVAEVLGVAPEAVDPEVSLVDQGLDSMAMMLLASKWSSPTTSISIADLARRPLLGEWSTLVSDPTGGAGVAVGGPR